MTQQQRDQRRLAAAGRPDHAQGLAGRERERHVGERRRRLPRILERHRVELQRSVAQHRLGAMVVDRQRRAQDRLEPRPRRLAALHQRQHPARREHRPDQLAEVHAEARELADRQLLLRDQPAAEAEGQRGGRGQRDADRRLVRGFPLLRLVAAIGRRARAARQLRARARLEAECAQRAHAGDGFLHVVVELAEAVERRAPGVVHVARDHPEGPGHERERQQRDRGQPPVDAERHHADDEHEGQRAVEAGEERLARGHFDGIDVVGGARHEVAGALLLEVRRPLLRQPLVELRAQLDAEAIGRGEQLQSPADAQQVDGRAHRHQDRELGQQGIAAQRAGDEPVDHAAHLARHGDREHRHADEHRGGQQIGMPLAAYEAADQSVEVHGIRRLSRRRPHQPEMNCGACAPRVELLLLVVAPAVLRGRRSACPGLARLRPDSPLRPNPASARGRGSASVPRWPRSCAAVRAAARVRTPLRRAGRRRPRRPRGRRGHRRTPACALRSSAR